MKNWHNPELIKRFGAHFKKLRIEFGLTQKEIAVKAKIEQSHISEIEAGMRNLTLDNVLSLAIAMDIEPKQFFDFFVAEVNNIRHSQLNDITYYKKETYIQATADGFPKKETCFQSVGDAFSENETYLQLIQDEFPEMEMLLQ